MQGFRAALVVVHRWSGLFLAGFLVLAGFTGSLLAWNDRLDAWIYPALEAQAHSTNLDPLTIRDQLQARYPQVDFASINLYTPPGKAMVFNAHPKAPIAGQPSVAANFDQVFVAPHTGEVQGTRMWGELSQGSKNLMPFVHRLHYSLLRGEIGTTVLGIAALTWTLNCFVGLALTFPLSPRRNQTKSSSIRSKPWLRRWQPAWKIRWNGGSAKLNFDLHRATSLWLWVIFSLIAWSALSLSLPKVFNPVVQALMPHQKVAANIASLPESQLLLSWSQARTAARELMHEQSVLHGFAIEYETALHYDARMSIFRYVVRSDRDIRAQGGDTQLWLNAHSGTLIALWLPTGQAGADTFTTWLKALHKAALWGVLWRCSLTLTGVLLIVACIAGIQIWIKRVRAQHRVTVYSR